MRAAISDPENTPNSSAVVVGLSGRSFEKSVACALCAAIGPRGRGPQSADSETDLDTDKVVFFTCQTVRNRRLLNGMINIQ